MNERSTLRHLARVRVVWPGSASDGALPGVFLGTGSASSGDAMREHEEEDPKKPQPVWIAKKRSNPSEASEAVPCRKDNERDFHRHVV